MEKISKEDSIKIFNKPKRTLEKLDSKFKKDKTEMFIRSLDEGETFSVFDEDGREVCATNSVYNSLVGLLFFNYGVGKDPSPAWLIPQSKHEDDFEDILSKLDDHNPFPNLERVLGEGGIVYFNSNKNDMVCSLPPGYSFSQGIQLRHAKSFSEGLTQVEGSLAVLTQMKEAVQ